MALGGLPTSEFYHENYTDVTTGPHPAAEPGPALSRVKPRLRECPGTVLRTKAQAEQDGGLTRSAPGWGSAIGWMPQSMGAPRVTLLLQVKSPIWARIADMWGSRLT